MEINPASISVPQPDLHQSEDAGPVTFTPEERARALQALKNLRGMFAGSPSLEDDYFRDRDKDQW